MIGRSKWTHLNEHLEPKPQDARAHIIECPACGYEPNEHLVIRRMRRPKCHLFTWRRVPRPGMLADTVVGAPTLDRHADHAATA